MAHLLEYLIQRALESMDRKALTAIVTPVVAGVVSKLILDVLESPNMPWLAKAALVGGLLAFLGWIVIRALNVIGRKEADAQAPRTTETNHLVSITLSRFGCDAPAHSRAPEWNTTRLPGSYSAPARPSSPTIYSSAPRIVKK